MSSKDTSGKKTLTLGASIDLAKVAEIKQKKSKGSVIEIKGSASVNTKPKATVQSTVSSNTVQQSTVNTTTESGRKLTEEEIKSRIAALDNLKLATQTESNTNSGDDSAVLGTIKVVQKTSVLENTTVENNQTDSNVENSNANNSSNNVNAMQVNAMQQSTSTLVDNATTTALHNTAQADNSTTTDHSNSANVNSNTNNATTNNSTTKADYKDNIVESNNSKESNTLEPVASSAFVPSNTVVQKTMQAVVRPAIVRSAPKEQPVAKAETTTEATKDTKSLATTASAKAKDFKNDKSAKNSSAEESESSANKNKKSNTTEFVKKTPANNWRNLDVALINNEEDDFEDDFEEAEEVVKEVVVRRPAFVKRKRKYAPNKQKQYVNIEIKDDISVIDLAKVLQEKVIAVVKAAQSLGISAKQDSILDTATAELVATELGHTAKAVERESIEDILNTFDDSAPLSKRAPVVAIMGHVDHGKTSLLDAIRKTNVVSGESGGITQHIGAYQITTPTKDLITFLDTPGHEAFSAIRSRGSKVTDIILLVVAADDGLKPQTIEAIEHAQKANVPLIVVVNKIDKQDTNVMRIKTDLLQHNVVVEEMGGETLIVEVSAMAKIGLDKLLEAILLQAEVLDLKTNNSGRAKGTVIEVKMQKGLGFLATVLLERGTLALSDYFVCGTKTGRVKMIMDDKGARLKKAPAYLPIEISGFNDTVQAGDSFLVVNSEKEASALAEYRIKQANRKSTITSSFNLQNLLSQNVDQTQTLSVIVKTDTQGSLEAITDSLEKIIHPEIKVKVILGAVGEISESDVNFAKTSKAIIFGFNSRANTNAKQLANKEKIELRYHSIIYKIIDDVKMIMSGMLDPEIVENIVGYAEVKQVFNITKLGNIAGCVVTEGSIKKSAFVRLLRNNVVLYDDVLSQLKHFKDEVKEVKSGSECGIAFANYNDIIAGDFIECYEKTSNKKIVK